MFAFSMTPSVRAAYPTATQKSDFCGHLSSISKEVIGNIDAGREHIDNGQPNFVNGIMKRRDEFDNRLKSARSLWDHRRNQQYIALTNHAKTDAQKAAIESYKATIESAINARRVSVDEAISNFRVAVDSRVSSDRGNIDKAALAFKDQVQAAINIAQHSCSEGAPSEQVRQDLSERLHDIRQVFEQRHQGVDQVRAELVALDQQKRALIEAAVSQFKQTAETAAQSLKANFGGDQSLARPSLSNSL